MLTIVFGGMHAHSNLPEQASKRDRAYRAYTQEILEQLNFFRLSASADPLIYKHKATIVNVYGQQQWKNKTALRHCTVDAEDSTKPQDCQKLVGDNMILSAYHILSIKCCPHTVIAPSSV